MSDILRVQNVSKTYEDNAVQALRYASFEVHEGELISVIGPSGSGKSTLLRCINRMIDVSEGSIQFLNYEVTCANKRQIKDIRRNIGMIFQHYNLVYRLNVLENVLHGRLGYYPTWKSTLGMYSQKDIEQAAKLLEMLGLGDKLYDKCCDLSGGQKQRVGIARALLQNPKIMLCDEPIASLDPQSSKVIMEHLKAITTNMRIPCIVNLHQVDVALHYSDRIIGMHQGSIVFNGKPQELGSDVIEKIYGVPMNELIKPSINIFRKRIKAPITIILTKYSIYLSPGDFSRFSLHCFVPVILLKI